MNGLGTITGYYMDVNNVSHGFVRSPDGAIVTFDAPGAGTGSGQGTFAQCINPSGTIAGDYTAESGGGGVYHGFAHSSDGTITTFDPPDSFFTITNNGSCINAGGEITGTYGNDQVFMYYGFVRTSDGAFTTFGDGGTGTATFPNSVN